MGGHLGSRCCRDFRAGGLEVESLGHAESLVAMRRKAVQSPSLRSAQPIPVERDFELEASVCGIRPRIWRRFCMPGRYTFANLHTALQILFGWKDYHLHLFQHGTVRLGDLAVLLDGEFDEMYDDVLEERDYKLQRFMQPGQVLTYEYDFGDSWIVEIRVIEATSADPARRPRVQMGERAGPPEDCGGTSGYDELLAALADKNHTEHAEMQAWVGRAFQPDRFDIDAINRALTRRFPPPRVAPVRTTPEPYDASSGPPRLEHYRLEALNLRQKMFVALQEGPMSFDELTERLRRAGVAFEHGEQSLRKAWKRQPPIRQRLDGRLELDVDHPEYTSTDRVVQAVALPRAERPPQSPRDPVDETRPLTFDELARLPIPWPRQWPLRRRLLMCADARADFASLDDLREDLRRLREPAPDVISAVSLRGDAFRLDGAGRVAVDENHPDVLSVRKVVRTVLRAQEDARRAEAARAVRRAERLEARETERRAFESSKRGFVRMYAGLGRFCGSVLLLPDMTVQTFEAAAPMREMLRTLDWVFGIDPRRDFEHLGLEVEGQRLFDLTPPFTTVSAHGYSRRVSIAAIVAMSVPSQPGLSTPDEREEILSTSGPRALLDRLSHDVRLLHRFWRYAVEHRGVINRGEGTHWVDWDVGNERTM